MGFGFKLFQSLNDGAEGRNVFYSPASVQTALRMALLGAGGETREAMANTLGGEAGGRAPGKQDYVADVTLEEANSLWSGARYKIEPDYVKQVKARFDARAEQLVFTNPDAAAKINAWVSERTHGKIDKIVGQLNEMTALVLVNAIYFKGKWQKVFKTEETQEAPFHPVGGGESKVQMMSQRGSFQYLRGDGYQAIKLPYGDGRIEMIVALPDEAQGLDAFVRGLDAARWQALVRGLRKQEGLIKLPRFKAEFEQSLNEPLKALGMAVAFDPEHADFSKIVAPPLRAYISQVKHKAVVEVNEEGSEAAAATSVEISVTSAMPMEPPKPFEMIVDRPFLCAIRDARSGEILFLGAIRKP